MITASVGVNSSLLLEPAHQLTFWLSRDEVQHGVQAVLKLTNISSHKRTVFKVRTNNADMFTVKPVHGVIPPGEALEVLVSVVPTFCARLLSIDPKELATRDDERFLIQSVERSDDMRGFDVSDLVSFWKRIPIQLVTNSKIGCRFAVVPEGDVVLEGVVLDTTSQSLEQWVQRQRQQLKQSEHSHRSRRQSSPTSNLDRTIDLRDVHRRRSGVEAPSPDVFESSSSSASNDSEANADATIQPLAPQPPRSLLFSIHPSDTLVFNVNSGTTSTPMCDSASFFVTNKSRKHALAFKVKTTNHEGYFVKPSRGLIGPANAQQIEVSMASHPPRARTAAYDAHRQEGKDRFMVEIVRVDIAYYQDLLMLDDKALKRELFTIWGSAEARQREKRILGCQIVDRAAKQRGSESNQDEHDMWC